MKRLGDRFALAAARCQSLPELQYILDDATRELGFTYFALIHHAAIDGPRPPLVRLHNYPDEWVARLEAEAKATDDPVHLACRRAVGGFSWEGIESLTPLDAAQRRRLEASRAFGLGEGFTVPINVPGEPAGSCSFAVRRDEALPNDRLLTAELIGLHAFQAARSLVGDALRPPRPRLSPREQSCLKLVARGKSDWEISVILGISVETARQYVKRARAAYDVVSRTQLVVFGLRDDWLDYDEALTPLKKPPSAST